MKDEFAVDDLLVPMLKFSDPTPIKIRLTDAYIFLNVGQRDWQWDRETGELIGSGTSLCSEFEGAAPPQVS